MRVEGKLRDVEQRLVWRRRRRRSWSAWVHEVLWFPVLCELKIGVDCITFEPRSFIRKALNRNFRMWTFSGSIRFPSLSQINLVSLWSFEPKEDLLGLHEQNDTGAPQW